MWLMVFFWFTHRYKKGEKGCHCLSSEPNKRWFHNVLILHLHTSLWQQREYGSTHQTCFLLHSNIRKGRNYGYYWQAIRRNKTLLWTETATPECSWGTVRTLLILLLEKEGLISELWNPLFYKVKELVSQLQNRLFCTVRTILLQHQGIAVTFLKKYSHIMNTLL